MSEETSYDTSCEMSQVANQQEKCPQECPPTDDATADELFDSFMEIANNPELRIEQEDTQNGTTNEAIAASVFSKDSSADEQKDTVSGTHDQTEINTSTDPSVSQLKDISSSSVELQADHQTETNDGSETIETEQKSTPNGPCDHSETTVGQSSDPIISQAIELNNSGNTEKADSAGSSAATRQLNSDDNPVHSATEVPVEGSEDVLPNPVSDEGKSDELSVTTDVFQPNSDVKSEVDRTEDLSHDTENTEKRFKNSEIPVANNKEILPDEKEHGVDCAVSADNKEELPSDNDPSTSETDVAKRLSKAMEDLAGLEKQLSSAVMEIKQSNSEKTIAEESDGKQLNVDTQEVQSLENETAGEVVSQANVADTTETRVDDELHVVVSKVVKDEECNVPSVQETGENTTVCETDADLNAVSVDSNNKETLVENTDGNDTDVVDVVHGGCQGTDVDVVEVQDAKVENPESVESDNIQVPTTEDAKIESKAMDPSETPDGPPNPGQDVESEAPVGTAGSQTETKVEESNNGEESSIDKSDSMDELDKEVAKACMSIPDIEVTTDESGISENKSLDSVDTEGSSNGRPASPAYSDDGIDSDTPSDYGDDDDEGTFDPGNFGASRRKSWLLEIDRDRLSSDSSTVSEHDFKENYSKGDNTDGKSRKEGEYL